MPYGPSVCLTPSLGKDVHWRRTSLCSADIQPGATAVMIWHGHWSQLCSVDSVTFMLIAPLRSHVWQCNDGTESEYACTVCNSLRVRQATFSILLLSHLDRQTDKSSVSRHATPYDRRRDCCKLFCADIGIGRWTSSSEKVKSACVLMHDGGNGMNEWSSKGQQPAWLGCDRL